MGFDIIHALDQPAALSISEVQGIVQQAFSAMLGEISVSAAEEAIRSGKAAPILDLSKPWEELAKILGEAFTAGGALGKTFYKAAEMTSHEAPLAAKPLDLKPIEDYAVRYLDQEGGRLISQITESTQQAIVEIIQQTFTGPIDVQQAARELVALREFGLSSRGQASLLNYTADLQAQVDEGDMSVSQMRHLAGVRGQALRRERGVLVAQTESYNAGNAGRRKMYEEAADQGELDTEVYVLRWVTRAIHVCPRCEALHDKTAEIKGGEFVSSPVKSGNFAGKVIKVKLPTVHPGCFCAIQSVRKSDL